MLRNIINHHNKALGLFSRLGIAISLFSYVMLSVDQLSENKKIPENLTNYVYIFLHILIGVSFILIILHRKNNIRDFFTAFWNIGKIKDYLYVENYKRNISILLPLSSSEKHFEREVENSLIGVGNALKHSKKYLEKVDIRFFDHKNDPKLAAKIIKDELRRGTKHFISTMSVVCDDLVDSKKSTYFNRLVKDVLSNNEEDFEEKKNAILVCTMAASETTNFNDNLYRFFVQTDHEARELVAKCFRNLPTNNDKVEEEKKEINVAVIHSTKHYHVYLGQLSDKIYKLIKNGYHASTNSKIKELKLLECTQDASTFISCNKAYLESADVVFLLVEYDLNERLIELFIDNKLFKENAILATSSLYPGILKSTHDLKHKALPEKLKEIDVNLVFVKPMRKHKTIDIDFYGDMSEFCMSVVVRKMINILNEPGYTVPNFHRLWVEKDIPSTILISYDENNGNDPFIELN